jgi:hypothetical protein
MQSHNVGFVGGSDLPKLIEQIGADLINEADYAFAENGCVFLKKGEL